MSLAGDLANAHLSEPHRGPSCTVCRLLLDLPEDEAQALRDALTGPAMTTVIVVSEHGNHGRTGTKRDGLPKHDNVDLMCYQMAASILADEKRLTWNIDTEDIKRVEYGNYRALLIHGDEIGRLGFASPMTIVRHADRWRSGAYPGFEFRDLFLGHWHQHQEWNMANGQGTVYMTGSIESSNRYARDLMASNGSPSQRLLFVDPDKGRVTANYRVWLDQ